MLILSMFGYMYCTCTFFFPTCSDQVQTNLPYSASVTTRSTLPRSWPAAFLQCAAAHPVANDHNDSDDDDNDNNNDGNNGNAGNYYTF